MGYVRVNKSPMKTLLFVSPHYFPVMGGIEQSIYNITERLSAHYNIQIGVPAGSNPEAKEFVNGVKICRLSPLGFIVFDLRNIDTIVLTNFSIYPHVILLIRLALLKCVGVNKRPKLILVPHGGAILQATQFSYIRFLIKRAYNTAFAYPLCKYVVDRWVAVSEWEKGLLLEQNLTKQISVIRNGVNEISNTESHKESYLVFVGRIQPIKNLHGIVTAFKEIRHLTSEVKTLVIVGDFNQNASYYESIKSYIRDEGLENCVHFVGEKLGREKDSFIAHAQALLCLSDVESDAIAVKEALALRTKVILRPIAALREYLNGPNALEYKEPGCYAVHPSTLERFIQAPFTALASKQLSTWDEVASKYAEIM